MLKGDIVGEVFVGVVEEVGAADEGWLERDWLLEGLTEGLAAPFELSTRNKDQRGGEKDPVVLASIVIDLLLTFQIQQEVNWWNALRGELLEDEGLQIERAGPLLLEFLVVDENQHLVVLFDMEVKVVEEGAKDVFSGAVVVTVLEGQNDLVLSTDKHDGLPVWVVVYVREGVVNREREFQTARRLVLLLVQAVLLFLAEHRIVAAGENVL